ncbi:MAG: hypothetical protein AAFQ54_06065 [Pseudomonadota bacterium]
MTKTLILLAVTAFALAACSEIAEHGGLQGLTWVETEEAVLA